MLDQQPTTTEQGTVYIDFSRGFDEGDIKEVLDIIAERSTDNLRRFAKDAVHSHRITTDEELKKSLRPETIKALQNIPGGVAWWKQNKPVIETHADGVIEVVFDEVAEAEARNKQIEGEIARLQMELDAVTEEMDGLDADRPGMRNFPQRSYDDLIERHDDLSRRLVELERSL
ncbi:hypothetical protein BH10ACI2_BH10ACI2_00320 [soil metagenome]